MTSAPPVLGPPGTLREPKKVAWLALATLGVYGLVWFYKFGKEVQAAGKFTFSPKKYYVQFGVLAALIVTLPVALAHFFVYAYQVAKHLEILASRTGRSTTELTDRFALLIAPFAGVAFLAMMQRVANDVWSRFPKG